MDLNLQTMNLEKPVFFMALFSSGVSSLSQEAAAICCNLNPSSCLQLPCLASVGLLKSIVREEDPKRDPELLEKRHLPPEKEETAVGYMVTLLCSRFNKNRHKVVWGDLDWTRTSLRITCSAVSRKHLPVTCPSLIYLLSTI